jgi:hypothetical protein
MSGNFDEFCDSEYKGTSFAAPPFTLFSQERLHASGHLQTSASWKAGIHIVVQTVGLCHFYGQLLDIIKKASSDHPIICTSQMKAT